MNIRGAGARRIDVREGVVRAGEIRLHYFDWGRGQAPPVVVLHGLMGNGREWDTLVGILAAEFRVVAVDQRGHGRSSWARSYRATDLADDVLAVADELRLGSFSVVGHSMGGMAALLAAAARPDRVRRLALIDIGPDSLTTPLAEQLPALVGELGRASYREIEEAVEIWLAGDPLAQRHLVHHWAAHNLVPDDDGRLRWAFDAAGLIRFVTEGVTEDELWAAARRVEAPVLVVRGEESALLSAQAAARLVGALSRGSLVEISGAGHDLGVQRPVAVAAAVRDFLC